MKDKLRAWAELLRVANLWTVPGDVVAGFWLTAGATAATASLWFALAIAVLLYAMGLALNDLCDATLDAQERPARPIPSGRLSPKEVRTAVGLLLLGSLGIASYLSWRVVATSLALTFLIFFYNLWAKRCPWIGIPVMALCRGGSFCLGWAATGLDALPHLGACGILMLYIALVSIVAVHEAKPEKIFPLTYLPGIGLGVASAFYRNVPWFNLLALVLALRTLFLGAALGQKPSPDAVQKTVGLWLVGLPFVQGLLLLLGHGIPVIWLAGVMLLALPARLLGRTFRPS